jgi:hypothetical protein
MKKHYHLLYGYNRDNFLELLANQQNQTNEKENIIIVIEPRGQYIEEFKKEFKIKNNVILESKLIWGDKLKLKCDLYKKDNVYSIDLVHNYQKRENVFCTTLTNLIEKYNIQNISNFIISWNLLNLDTLLKEFFLYHHFISNVELQKDIQFDIFNSFIENQKKDSKITYVNRNLDIDLPNICLYTIDYPLTSINKPKLLQMVKQYEIEILNENEIIPCEEIQNIIESDGLTSKEKFNIRMIPDRIESIIKKKYYDIIIQFNTKYFNLKPFFQLMYPLKENILYINQGLDIIYGSGKTMYKMYEMMYSEKFKEYINSKREQKGKVYHFFEKRYFYEYLLSKFQTISVE